jgi:hypothetical protein
LDKRLRLLGVRVGKLLPQSEVGRQAQGEGEALF